MSYVIKHNETNDLVHHLPTAVRSTPEVATYKTEGAAKAGLTRHIAKWNKITQTRIDKYGLEGYKQRFSREPKFLTVADFTVLTYTAYITAR